MVRDDHDDPFDNILDEVEQMMNDMIGGNAEFTSEAHIDMYDKGSALRLVADLLSVDKDAIDLRYDGEVLTISVVDGRCEHDERIRLLIRTDEHSASATFSSSVLQVTFGRTEDSTAIDVE